MIQITWTLRWMSENARDSWYFPKKDPGETSAPPTRNVWIAYLGSLMRMIETNCYCLQLFVFGNCKLKNAFGGNRNLNSGPFNSLERLCASGCPQAAFANCDPFRIETWSFVSNVLKSQNYHLPLWKKKKEAKDYRFLFWPNILRTRWTPCRVVSETSATVGHLTSELIFAVWFGSDYSLLIF